MSIIKIQDLSFSYDGSYDSVFEHVSFQIDTDWKLGFIGRNGRGKTTLLKLLLGEYEYQGSITASVGFDYFPFGVADECQNTLDAVRVVIPDFEHWRLVRELSLLEVPEEALYRPFGTLSHGERTKVWIAALFLRENRFLLIDEPTNHLDQRARTIVSRYLKSKKGFILVSHDREFLDGCVDHILSINRAEIEIQKGNFSSWWENKKRRDEFELAEETRLKKDIKKLSAAARRTASWSDRVEATKIGTHAADRGAIGHKAAKMMKRSKAVEARREEAVSEKEKLLKNLESAEELSIRPLRYHSERLLQIEDLEIFFGEKIICENISFSISRGERVALTGKNGSGKSSILKLAGGEEIPHRGRVELGSRLIVSLVPQDTAFLRGDLKTFAEESGIDKTLFKAILRKLDFSREQFEKDILDFSGGQKKKVLLARSLCERAHLYIWDEPLNFIDLLSRIQIEELLLKDSPAMLFVEHDAAFVRKIATTTVAL